MPVTAGGWAALLVAATPIYGGIPFEVRPDMLGIAFQMTGILLVLAAIANVPVRESKLNAAAVCFAAAVCTKQQFLVAPLVSVVLMVGARASGRLGVTAIARFVAIASCLTVLYYGEEEWVTGGRMSKSVFIAARNVGRVHPADWSFATNLLLAVVWKCVGPILLLAAAGLAIVSARSGHAQRAFVIAGTSLIGAVVVLAALQFFTVRIGITRTARDRIARRDRRGNSRVCALREITRERSAGPRPLDLFRRRDCLHLDSLAAEHGGLVQLRDPRRGHRLYPDGPRPARTALTTPPRGAPWSPLSWPWSLYRCLP